MGASFAITSLNDLDDCRFNFTVDPHKLPENSK